MSPYDQDADHLSVSPKGAKRYNAKKPRLSQVFWFDLDGLVAHMEAGREKYPDAPDGTPNWRLGGQSPEEFLDAACRHIRDSVRSIEQRELYDDETGTMHADAIAWNALAMRTNCFPLDEYPARVGFVTRQEPPVEVRVSPRVPPLDDISVLRAVAMLDGATTLEVFNWFTDEETGRTDGVTWGKVYYRLNKLEGRNLLHRPGGMRAPYYITDLGREELGA